MKLLVTGASGFIGRALCERLTTDGDVVVATARTPITSASWGGPVEARELAPETHWEDVLDSVDVVVHAAARVHQPGGQESLADYLRVNVTGTMNLARQAASCGVRRFVFLSSVKVNGEATRPGHPFHADDRPAPADAYARSKYEAEVELSQLSTGRRMDIVIIRPPLVYGPGVKANFLSLMRWIYKGYPLPFAHVDNLRSFIAVDNLVDLVKTCCMHPHALNETFMAADGEDISTPDLIARLGTCLDRPARLFPVSPKLLSVVAGAAGKRAQMDKMLATLQVDARKSCERLGWRPVVTMDQALKSTARHFLALSP